MGAEVRSGEMERGLHLSRAKHFGVEATADLPSGLVAPGEGIPGGHAVGRDAGREVARDLIHGVIVGLLVTKVVEVESTGEQEVQDGGQL